MSKSPIGRALKKTNPPLICCQCSEQGLSQPALDAILSFAAMNRTPTVLLEFGEHSAAEPGNGKLVQQLQQLSEFGVTSLQAHHAGSEPLSAAASSIRWVQQGELEELHRQAHAILSY